MIYCTVGVTGSGKSTWVKNIVKNHSYYVINDDALWLMLGAGEYFFDKGMSLFLKQKMIDLAKELDKKGIDVILDSADWFLSSTDRLECNFDEHEVTWVVFSIPHKEFVKDKRSKDNRGISIETWMDVYEIHLDRFEIPKNGLIIFER
jgi:predicted kinase